MQERDPFGALSRDQRERLAAYADLLRSFNEKINLISRETQSDILERHIRHVLALTTRAFPAGSSVVDWGTGGGLPSIPLAVCFPDVTFHAVDAVGKKVSAVQAMARKLGLKNLHAWHTRAEQWTGRAHYSVSRATAPMIDLWNWHVRARGPFWTEVGESFWQPGLICLKGGDLIEEMAQLQAAFPDTYVETMELSAIMNGINFQEKVLVQVRD
jgi:16S rRNA (guanine527-N7)-methyltransferase